MNESAKNQTDRPANPSEKTPPPATPAPTPSAPPSTPVPVVMRKQPPPQQPDASDLPYVEAETAQANSPQPNLPENQPQPQSKKPQAQPQPQPKPQTTPTVSPPNPTQDSSGPVKVEIPPKQPAGSVPPMVVKPKDAPEPPKQAASVAQGETLPTDAVLASPTPVDFDPPPLHDVAPLSPTDSQNPKKETPPLVGVNPSKPKDQPSLGDAGESKNLDNGGTTPEAKNESPKSSEAENPKPDSLDLPDGTIEPKPAEALEVVVAELAEEEKSSPGDPITNETSTAPKDSKQSEGYVKNEFFVSEGAEDPWILPAAAAAAVTPNKKRSSDEPKKLSIWSIFTSLFFFGSLLLLGCLAAAWFMRGTIFEKIEANVNQRIADAGYHIDYGTWKYEPVRGLVLGDVTVYEDPAKTLKWARIDNVGVNADLLAIFKSKDPGGVAKTISFRESNLDLFDQNELVAQFTQLKGALEISPGRADFDRLKGKVEGLRFDLGGAIRYPNTQSEVASWETPFPNSSSIATSGGDQESDAKKLLQTLGEELSEAAEKAAQESRDAALEKTRAAEEEVQRKVQSVGELSPGSIILRDDAPQAPSVQPEISRPAFAPRDDIPLPAPEPVKEEPAVPPSIPEPAVAQNADRKAGTAKAPQHKEPESPPPAAPSSESLSPPGDKNGKLPSLAFLRHMIPYLKIKSSGEAPLLTGNIDADLHPVTPKLQAKGRLTGQKVTLLETALKGIPFENLDIPFFYDRSTEKLDLPNFSIGHGKGALSGTAGYGIASRVLSLQGVQSTVNLLELAAAMNPSWGESFKNLKFLDAPRIHVSNGRIPFGDPGASQLNFSYQHWAGMLIDIAGKSLPIREISGAGKLTGPSLFLRNVRAKVLDGPAVVDGSLKLSGGFPFNGSVQLSGVPLESISRFSGIENDLMKGLLFVDYQGQIAKDLSSLGGRGSLELQNSQLYKVPVVGPVQRLLGAAIPVFGAEKKSAVTADFEADSGILMTQNLLVRSDGTKIGVKGHADLTRQVTQFTAQASLDGPLGLATGLISEMIEIEGRGPLTKPVLSLKGGALPAGFDNESVKAILGIAEGSNEAMTAVVREIAAGSGALGTILNGIGADNKGGAVSGAIQGVLGQGTETKTNVPRAAPVDPNLVPPSTESGEGNSGGKGSGGGAGEILKGLRGVLRGGEQ